jgi:steroid 5-alpha reductase family enzyme
MVLLTIGTAIAVIGFALVWLVSARLDNYGFLDVAWSLSLAVLAPLYAFLGTGDPVHRCAFAAVGALWRLRLGLYILLRVRRMHPREDARYRTLRERWRGPARFPLFYQLQAAIAVLLALSFLPAALNPRPGLGVLELLGLALALLACGGESLADWQAQRCTHDPAHRGAVLDVGRWRYSRHPNYFFESLVWWGFGIAARDSPYGALTVACPVLML